MVKVATKRGKSGRKQKQPLCNAKRRKLKKNDATDKNVYNVLSRNESKINNRPARLAVSSPTRVNDIFLSNLKALADPIFDAVYRSQQPNDLDLFQKLLCAKNLFLIDTESYDHYKMKLLSPHGESEVAKLSVLNDNRVHNNKNKSETCSICYEILKGGLKCPAKDHYYCKTCFNTYVSSMCFKELNQAVANGFNLKEIIKRKGKILCPGINCKKEENKCFTDSEIIEHCNKEVILRYMNTLTYATVQNEAMTKVQDFLQKVSNKLPQFDRENRRQSLKNACPGARMCRKCYYGPMEKSHCDDLQAHSHQYQNACPRCGDHASTWSDLPEWDGKLPEETKIFGDDDSRNNEKGSNKLVNVELCNDFFLHIKFPIEGHLLIRPSLGECIIPVLISSKSHCWQVHRPNISSQEDTKMSYVFSNTSSNTTALVGIIADESFFVSGVGCVKITENGTSRHAGSFSGCGGNPNGKCNGARHGNCSSKCKKCGSNTHWTCCSSTNKSSVNCLFGISEAQARMNATLCRQGKGNSANYKLGYNLTKNKGKNPITFSNGKIASDEVDSGGSSNVSNSSKTTTHNNNKRKYSRAKHTSNFKQTTTLPSKASMDAFSLGVKEIDLRKSKFVPLLRCNVRSKEAKSARDTYDAMIRRWGARDSTFLSKEAVVIADSSKCSTTLSCKGSSNSSLPVRKVHTAMFYHFPVTEALKVLKRKSKAKVFGDAVAYSLENSIEIVKGHKVYVECQKSENSRFTIVCKNAKLFEEMSSSKKRRNKSNSTSASQKLCARAKLNAARHVIDWKNNMVFTTSGQVFKLIKNEAFVVDTIEIISGQGKVGRHEDVARGSSTRTIKLGKTWEEFATNASKALKFDVKTAYIMKQIKGRTFSRMHRHHKQYTVSGVLYEKTFEFQSKFIIGTDLLLCYDKSVEEQQKEQNELRSRNVAMRREHRDRAVRMAHLRRERPGHRQQPINRRRDRPSTLDSSRNGVVRTGTAVRNGNTNSRIGNTNSRVTNTSNTTPTNTTTSTAGSTANQRPAGALMQLASLSGEMIMPQLPEHDTEFEDLLDFDIDIELFDDFAFEGTP